MSFMKPIAFSDLAPTDIFYTDDGQQGKDVWMKIVGQAEFNAISDDGTRTGSFDGERAVNVIRKRIHVLDLRQGDQVCMAAHLGIGYMTSTVLKIEVVKGSRIITFFRPMVNASGFGTTCPSGSVHTEKFSTSVGDTDTKRDDYYHLVGVDTSAIYDSYKLVLHPGGCADRHRMAVFIRAMGDEREMAELLCLDGLKLNSETIGRLYEYIKHRETPPEYPDRDDRAESKYEKNLVQEATRRSLSKHERRYLAIVEARRNLAAVPA